MNNSRSTKISVGMFYQIQSDICRAIMLYVTDHLMANLYRTFTAYVLRNDLFETFRDQYLV